MRLKLEIMILLQLNCYCNSSRFICDLNRPKGLFTENPTSSSQAELIQSVDVDDEMLSRVASKSHSEFGTGGMETKIKAARIVARLGIDTIIASGLKSIFLKIKSKIL